MLGVMNIGRYYSENPWSVHFSYWEWFKCIHWDIHTLHRLHRSQRLHRHTHYTITLCMDTIASHCTHTHNTHTHKSHAQSCRWTLQINTIRTKLIIHTQTQCTNHTLHTQHSWEHCDMQKKGSDARALRPWASTDHRESYNLILRRLHHIPILRQRPALWRRVTACYRAHSHRLTWVKGRINTTERIIQEWIRSERSNPLMNAVATWWCDVRDIDGGTWALLDPSINLHLLYEGIDHCWVDQEVSPERASDATTTAEQRDTIWSDIRLRICVLTSRPSTGIDGPHTRP